MKKMSLQWRLTCIITVYIAVICACLTMLVYKNGVYYIDSLKETVDARGDEKTDDADEIYISVFRKIIGMRLRTIFPSRYIITRPTTGKTV